MTPNQIFNQIHNEFRPIALKIATRFMKNPAEAQDIVQAVMLSLWHQIQAGVTIRNPRQWFAAAVKNACLNVLESKHDTISLTSLLAEETEPSEEVYQEPAIDPRLREALREAVDTLPARVSEVLSAFYYGARTVDQIAKAMGVSKSTVTSHLVHGRNALRGMFVRAEKKVA